MIKNVGYVKKDRRKSDCERKKRVVPLLHIKMIAMEKHTFLSSNEFFDKTKESFVQALRNEKTDKINYQIINQSALL